MTNLSVSAAYFIKRGYVENLSEGELTSTYDDDELSSRIYQTNIYCLAADIVKSRGLRSVLDIGCGYGWKLKTIIAPVCNDISGIDGKHAIGYATKAHGFGNWYVDDIENPRLKITRYFDLILAVDVIEHLKSPDSLISYILRVASQESVILISTPERDRVHGKNHCGPPKNPFHIREWNKEEFYRYIVSRGIDIEEQRLVGEQWLGLKKLIRDVIRFRRRCRIQAVVGRPRKILP